MCSLFAYLGDKPLELRSHLLETNRSLAWQACENCDGWGVIYSDGKGNMNLEKECACARDSKHFFSLARSLYTPLALAHIRSATVGPSDERNVHPFVHEKWAFAHNGTVQRFSQIKPKLDTLLPQYLKAVIKGETDSEHLFALFLYELELATHESGEKKDENDIVLSALLRSIEKINSLALVAGAKGDSRINILLTDGVSLWGTRFGKQLYHRTDPESGGLFISTQETDTNLDWEVFPENCIFFVSPGRDGIKMQPLLDRKPQFVAHIRQLKSA